VPLERVCARPLEIITSPCVNEHDSPRRSSQGANEAETQFRRLIVVTAVRINEGITGKRLVNDARRWPRVALRRSPGEPPGVAVPLGTMAPRSRSPCDPEEKLPGSPFTINLCQKRPGNAATITGARERAAARQLPAARNDIRWKMHRATRRNVTSRVASAILTRSVAGANPRLIRFRSRNQRETKGLY